MYIQKFRAYYKKKKYNKANQITRGMYEVAAVIYEEWLNSTDGPWKYDEVRVNIIRDNGNHLMCSMNEVELLRYIGIKDKNDKQICEGDILKYYGDNYNGVVEWDNDTCSFHIHEYYPKKEDDRFHEIASYTNEKEVIGNIFETPNLKNKWGT